MPLFGKTKHTVVSEFRCSEILEAARGVFSRKGFNNATVDDIADAAGVAKGTVYLYFKSKEDIYVETLRLGIAELQEEVGRNMDAEPDAAGKLRAFIRTRLAHGERNREFFRIYYSEFSRMMIHPVHVREEFQDLYNRQATVLEHVLEEGMGRGQLRPVNVPTLARLIYDLSRGLIAQRLLGWSQSSVEEDSALLFDVIWKGVGC